MWTLQMELLLAVIVSYLVSSQAAITQDQVDQIGRSLGVQWTLTTNTKEVERCHAKLTFTNNGQSSFPAEEWTLYFFSVYPVEPDMLTRSQPVSLLDGTLVLRHINGMLFSLTFNPTFKVMTPGASRTIRLTLKFWSVSWSDLFPNWYLTGPGNIQPRVVASTAGNDVTFATPHSDYRQQKRFDYDLYPARSAEQRYHRNHVPYLSPEAEGVRVVPKPVRLTLLSSGDVTLQNIQVFDATSGACGSEVTYLLNQLSAYSPSQAVAQEPTSNALVLSTGDIVIVTQDVMDRQKEAYVITSDPDNDVIRVKGQDCSGVFRGLQTVLSLIRDNGTVPHVSVADEPRFAFRGLFLDISRNFRSRAEIERLLRVMALYKLNKLHLHLADDEGWRLEIPGIPELTQMGSKRCHDLAEYDCLLPQLGSGPTSDGLGSGFLTLADYQAVLRLAQSLHIQVIPEIDMPGHARAAIKAMERRYKDYSGSNMAEAERYRLIDPNDPSVYTSPQIFNDNAINACRESSYVFIAKVVQEIKKMHASIQPLTEFHAGLDEVGRGAWVNSTMCHQLQDRDPVANQSVKQYFFKRVAEILHAEGLSMGAWEDGLMLEGNDPFNRSYAPNMDVYANVWDNVWEWATSSRTYTLANQGYKVVMSHATSLYFDHPYEPHWEERGFYWATRFTDTQTAFGFMPADYYANIDERRSGEPISREEVCGEDDVNCPSLEKPQNIVGMQGQLWSETSRTLDQADSMLFPRVLALAERAWHRAQWESETNVTARRALMKEDWYSFARAVGYRELPRLDKLGIKYRVPPPGAVVKSRKLWLATGYPGLQTEYSRDSGQNWQAVDGTEVVAEQDKLLMRSRSADGKRYSRAVELNSVPALPATAQPLLHYMCENLAVQYEVVDNYLHTPQDSYRIKITLTNAGDKPITTGNWALRFSNVQWIQADTLKEGRSFVIHDAKMSVSHVQGYLFQLSPLSDFPPLESNATLEIPLVAQYWSVSRYEQFPNYYLTADGVNPCIVKSTKGEELSFVKGFDQVYQWKRDPTDNFDPLTPSARFGKQADTKNLMKAQHPYLPTPRSYEMDRSQSVSVAIGWSIVAPAGWTSVATLLKDQLPGGATLQVQTMKPAARYIQLLQVSNYNFPSPGAYNLSVDPQKETVVITAADAEGAIYGVHSLVNMAMQSGDDKFKLFKLTVSDWPRFKFRGMFLDVSRNFHSKLSVKKLLLAMALYKLNKLHLHLADDEGWRLEIPGIPELTQVGATRCEDPDEDICLVPVIGSGPHPDNPGSGFYTLQDYREILQFAADRGIEVIPEFDMPGHARAAIKAMEARRRARREAGEDVEADQFSLGEEGDTSVYSSVQFYDDNAVNPCIASSLAFLTHVMTQVKKAHDGVSPLHTFHLGGDEVAAGAWLRSKACSGYLKDGVDLKHLLVQRVAQAAADLGLNLAGWEDGFMPHGDRVPYPRKDLAPHSVYANAWQNPWEWGFASRAYNLANAGYQVVMSQATHLYFDHPHEPDPEERGFYWATRYTDSRKVFSFQPSHLWNNIDITRLGEKLTREDICKQDNSGCPQLKEVDNVIGMQGHLFSETVRTDDQLEYMIFPRLLALAERAWHTAPWEGSQEAEGRLDDWTDFANTVGHGQLLLLDRLNVSYRLCPPGVRQQGKKLMVNAEFPGLKSQYMVEGSGQWMDVLSDHILVPVGRVVHVRTVSPDGQRMSKAVRVAVANTGSGSSSPASQPHLSCLVLIASALAASLHVLSSCI